MDVITTDQRTLTKTMFGYVIKTVVGKEILALQDIEITLNTNKMVIDAIKH